jgi:cytochrome b pre-mRNA-processing protein 3
MVRTEVKRRSVGLALFRTQPDPTVEALYGAIVTQARLPGFYASYGVPDTVEGRFDMIILHLSLVLRRLRSTPADSGNLGQALFDRFCSDMENNFREMGVSDLGVPKEMRRVGEAFYGRAAAYDRALDHGDMGALVEALSRNVFAGNATDGAEQLRDYVQQTERELANQLVASIAEGNLQFPETNECGPPACRTGKEEKP